MEVKFTVLGEPQGKGRPRFRRRGNFVQAFSDDATVSYENLVKVEYQRQCKGVFFQKGTPLELTITAYQGIPRSASKKKTAMMLSGEVRPLKKADSSNILKAVEDALNTVAYQDDVQIVELRMSKFYSDRPRIEVELRGIENEKTTKV